MAGLHSSGVEIALEHVHIKQRICKHNVQRPVHPIITLLYAIPNIIPSYKLWFDHLCPICSTTDPWLWYNPGDNTECERLIVLQCMIYRRDVHMQYRNPRRHTGIHSDTREYAVIHGNTQWRTGIHIDIREYTMTYGNTQ